jgi:hypothetical protein
MPELDPNLATFSRSDGLKLNLPLDQVGGDAAIDLLDVDWEGSILRSREGAKAFTVEAGAKNYESLFAHSDSILLARRGATTLVSLKLSDGKEVAEKSATTKAKHLAFTRLGTPTASYTFIADTESTLKRYDGTSFSEPTATVNGEAGKAMPKGQFLSTWIDEGNRLVIAGTAASGGPNGATSSSSHVWFSNAGAPEAYESTAFVQLNPGDGENIVGCCAWGGQIFVFKETRLFVFGGISPDKEEKPIFNFRTVDLGTRILPPSVAGGEQVTAGGEGVYFIANDGLWVTTGGEPSLLSEELDPLADSQALIGPAATTFGTKRWTDAKGICFSNNAVYVGIGATAVDLLLKFDLRALRWTVWKAALNSLVAWNEDTTTHRTRLFFSASAEALKHIYFYTPTVDTDPTVEMEARWQSGFYDVGGVDEKTLTNVKLWGTGNVNLKVAEDFVALGTATEYKLGEGTAIAQRQKQKGQTATLFSHQFSGTAPWSIQRISRYLRESRVPASQKP